MFMVLGWLHPSMSETQDPKRRAVEEEEPLKGQTVVKGPEWLRRLLLNESQNGK